MGGDVLVPELSAFEQIKHRDAEGREFWYARELMKLLGYTKWQNFERAIDEAITVVGQKGPDAVASNFTAISKNKSAAGLDVRGRKGDDYQLTRHACYVIAESADERKDEAAWAKIYFAYTTERYELLAPDRGRENPHRGAAAHPAAQLRDDDAAEAGWSRFRVERACDDKTDYSLYQ